MSDQSKYSLNGICHFENVPEQIAQNHQPQVELGTVGGVKCYAKLGLRTDDQGDVLFPTIWCGNESSIQKYVIRCFFSTVNRNSDNKKRFRNTYREISDYNLKIYGRPMQILDVLNQKNGWLDENGGLSIEYGVHIDSILEDDGIWRFNFYDKISDRDNMMTFETHNNIDYYCHKQLLSFHSPHLQNPIIEKRTFLVALLLSVAHGVQEKPNWHLYVVIIEAARECKLWNVERYCEQHMIYTMHDSPSAYFYLFHHAILFNSSRMLAQVLKRARSTKKLLKAVKIFIIEIMPPGTIKMIIASCVYGKFLSF